MAALGGRARPIIMRKFKKIMATWPVDPEKMNRDLATDINEKLGAKLSNGDFTVDEAATILQSLKRINSNYFKNMYPRENEIGFTGDKESLRETWPLSTDTQVQINSKSLWERIVGSKKPSDYNER